MSITAALEALLRFAFLLIPNSTVHGTLEDMAEALRGRRTDPWTADRIDAWLAVYQWLLLWPPGALVPATEESLQALPPAVLRSWPPDLVPQEAVDLALAAVRADREARGEPPPFDVGALAGALLSIKMAAASVTVAGEALAKAFPEAAQMRGSAYRGTEPSVEERRERCPVGHGAGEACDECAPEDRPSEDPDDMLAAIAAAEAAEQPPPAPEPDCPMCAAAPGEVCRNIATDQPREPHATRQAGPAFVYGQLVRVLRGYREGDKGRISDARPSEDGRHYVSFETPGRVRPDSASYAAADLELVFKADPVRPAIVAEDLPVAPAADPLANECAICLADSAEECDDSAPHERMSARQAASAPDLSTKCVVCFSGPGEACDDTVSHDRAAVEEEDEAEAAPNGYSGAYAPDEWRTGRFERVGLERYVHLIRSSADPERAPRPERGMDPCDRGARWRRDLVKLSAEDFKGPILELLSDGKPRTFNAIGVKLLDKTADVLFDLAPDVALWELVGREFVEHTTTAPILFRLRPHALEAARAARTDQAPPERRETPAPPTEPTGPEASRETHGSQFHGSTGAPPSPGRRARRAELPGPIPADWTPDRQKVRALHEATGLTLDEVQSCVPGFVQAMTAASVTAARWGGPFGKYVEERASEIKAKRAT